MAKPWSIEEKEYIEANWGVTSLPHIAKTIGRTIGATREKAGRMGLGSTFLSTDGITLNQLSIVIDIHYGILVRWVREYDLPAKKRRLTENRATYIVKNEHFWKWADKHRQLLDFSRFEKFALGPEPSWVSGIRELNIASVTSGKKSPWTENDDRLLRSMVNAHRYTYPEIAKRLKRSEAAIKRRLYDLEIKARPIRLNNHIKYTEKETSELLKLYKDGVPIDHIAKLLNKSALGVRGKLERMGFNFKDKLLVEKEIT